MSGFINVLVNKFLTNPTILIGILVLIGYLLRKESIVKTITGTICAMVGLQLIIFGGGQFSGVFKPITDAVCEATSITDNGKLPEGEARVSDGRIVEVPVIENEYQEPEGSEQEMPMTAEEAPVEEPEVSEQEIESVSENDNAPEENLVGEIVIDEIDEEM